LLGTVAIDRVTLQIGGHSGQGEGLDSPPPCSAVSNDASQLAELASNSLLTEAQNEAGHMIRHRMPSMNRKCECSMDGKILLFAAAQLHSDAQEHFYM